MSTPGAAQLAQLTRGVVLPLAALHDAHVALILGEVRGAWSELLRIAPHTAAKEQESGVSAWLEIELNRRLERNRRFRQLVSSVVRGRESLSADGRRLEVRPDLSFQLTSRSGSFPLTVECKLLDRRSDKRVRQYCDNGLLRFVAGDYAWWAQEGIMLAYVRDGSSFADSLEPHLNDDRASVGTLRWEGPLTLMHPLDAATTRHGRSFALQSGAPGPILIWHLWLHAPLTPSG